MKLVKTFGVIFALGGLSLVSNAQPSPSPSPSLYYSWTVTKWDNAKDVPFKKVREKLESSSRVTLQKVVKTTDEERFSKVEPVELYRSAMASYLLETKYRQASNFPFEACLTAIQKSPVNESYNFSRLRYILLLRRSRIYELKDLGVRLCLRDLKDYDVRYFLCTILRPEEKETDKKLAFSLLGQMKALQPHRPSLYSLSGSVHFRLWLKSKSSNERNTSLALYRKYLQLAPPDDPFRPQAQRIVSMLSAKD